MTPSHRPAGHPTSKLRQRITGIAGSLAVVGVFSAAAFVLHRELRAYHLSDIEQSLSLLSWGQLASALALTALSYTLLTGYDFLALQYIDRSLAYTRIALASFVSYVSSYNFGAILGGTTMRYRLYSTFGLSAIEIVKIIGVCTMTFVLGFCTLAGAVFVFDPLPLPDIIDLPIKTVFPIGIGLLAFVGLYLGASIFRRRPISIRGWEFSLPTPVFTLKQMAVATADLFAASGVLYVLLPAGMELGYPQFLGIFLTAQVAGILSHVPGGLGVFEVVLLSAVGTEHKAALMGSLVFYRLTYFFLPLGVATVLLAGYEGFRRRESMARYADMFGRWAPAIMPRVMASTTFTGGAVLLAFSALPRTVSRWHWLTDLLPLPVVEISHFVASVTGMGLLLLARGLLERLEIAYHGCVALLMCGIMAALLRGFNIAEAAILSVILGGLLPARKYFDRRASLLQETFTPGWITSIALVLLGVIWLGIFAHKHVEYSHALWWQFSADEDTARSLRSMLGAALVVGAAAVARALRPGEHAGELPDEEELAQAATIAGKSPRTYGYLSLLGDKSLLFNADRTALLMYAVEGNSWVSLGEPLGNTTAATELIWRFHEMCERRGGWPVFYQVSAERLPLYLDLGLSLLKLGDEGFVSLTDFSLDAPAYRWARDVVRDAQGQGCTFEIVPRPDVAALMPELSAIAKQWRTAHRVDEKGFSLGHFSPSYIERFPLAVVRQQGTLVGFANVWLGACQAELTVDVLRYRESAMSNLMDYLFIELMLWGRSEGYRSFSLGMVPPSGADVGPLAPLSRRLGKLVFRFGEHFDNVAGLQRFKSQFEPTWEARYLASPGGLRLPKILANVAALISGQGAANPGIDVQSTPKVTTQVR